MKVFLLQPPGTFRQLPRDFLIFARVAREAGHTINVMDANATADNTLDLSNQIKAMNVLHDQDVILCYLRSQKQWNKLKELLPALRKTSPDALILRCGEASVEVTGDFLSGSELDGLLYGPEQETAFEKVLEEMPMARGFESIDGLVVRRGGKILSNPPRSHAEQNEEDSLHPEYSVADIFVNSYFPQSELLLRQNAVRMNRRLDLRLTRRYPVGYIMKEIVYLRKRYACDFLGLLDNVTDERLLELADAFFLNELYDCLAWGVSLMIGVDTPIREDSARRAKEAGCVYWRVDFQGEAKTEKVLNVLWHLGIKPQISIRAELAEEGVEFLRRSGLEGSLALEDGEDPRLWAIKALVDQGELEKAKSLLL